MYSSLAKQFDKTKSIVVLTGAGISSESGIPTFRDGAGGLWKDYNPAELGSPEGFRKNPQLVWDWYNWRRTLVLAAEPNAAHTALAEWEKIFPRFQLITQNVDGLHLRAGSRKIVQMHGSIHHLKCLACSHTSDWITQDLVPSCPICGSHLRPDIVWFGEQLDSSNLSVIDNALSHCDIFLAIGTSGTVYPAAGFLDWAKKKGARTIVINPDPGSGARADHFIQSTATIALTELTACLKSHSSAG